MGEEKLEEVLRQNEELRRLDREKLRALKKEIAVFEDSYKKELQNSEKLRERVQVLKKEIDVLESRKKVHLFRRTWLWWEWLIVSFLTILLVAAIWAAVSDHPEDSYVDALWKDVKHIYGWLTVITVAIVIFVVYCVGGVQTGMWLPN